MTTFTANVVTNLLSSNPSDLQQEPAPLVLPEDPDKKQHMKNIIEKIRENMQQEEI